MEYKGDYKLTILNLEKVLEFGNFTLYHNKQLTKFIAPNLKKCGNYLLPRN